MFFPTPGVTDGGRYYGRAQQLAVDEGNTLYAVARCGTVPSLLRSTDGGVSFDAPIPLDFGPDYKEPAKPSGGGPRLAVLATAPGRVIVTASLDDNGIVNLVVESWDGGGTWTPPVKLQHTGGYWKTDTFLCANSDGHFRVGRIERASAFFYMEETGVTPHGTADVDTDYDYYPATSVSVFLCGEPLPTPILPFAEGVFGLFFEPKVYNKHWLRIRETGYEHFSAPFAKIPLSQDLLWAGSATGMTPKFFSSTADGGIYGFTWGTQTVDFFGVPELVPLAGTFGPGALSANSARDRVYALDVASSPGELTLHRLDAQKTITTRTIPAAATNAHHMALRDADAVLLVWEEGGAIVSTVQAF